MTLTTHPPATENRFRLTSALSLQQSLQLFAMALPPVPHNPARQLKARLRARRSPEFLPPAIVMMLCMISYAKTEQP